MNDSILVWYLEAEGRCPGRFRHLAELRTALFDRILCEAPAATCEQNYTLELGEAEIAFSEEDNDSITLAHSGWKIVTKSELSVCTRHWMKGEHIDWRTLLVYADRNDNDGYRWYELLFGSRNVVETRGGDGYSVPWYRLGNILFRSDH